MIDTLSIIIPTDEELRSHLKKISISNTRKNNLLDVVIRTSDLISVRLPSWDYNINIFVTDKYPNSIKVEFSVPKFVFGHNLYLIYPEELLEVMEDFRVYLNNSLDITLPTTSKWSVVRADFCYSWRYLTQDQATVILSSLQLYDQPRKKAHNYPGESLMRNGREITTKFYLKSPEFFSHDFKRIVKQSPDDAYRLLGIADGVLRYEVSIKHASLIRYFETKKVRLANLTDRNTILRIMVMNMDKMIRGLSKTAMTTAEVYEALKTSYKPLRALNLWRYYLLTRSTDAFVRSTIIKSLDRSTNWRYNSALKKAGVGIIASVDSGSYDILIPSKFVVNPNPIQRERRREPDAAPV